MSRTLRVFLPFLFGATLAATTLFLSICPTRAATCSFGAEVADEKYCTFFVQFSTGLIVADPRVSERLAAGGGAEIRSIALIVANSFYPNLPESTRNLAPAARDVENLIKFLVQDQKFDEVIVLHNGDATRDNLDYFLQSYIPQRGVDYAAKARFLFAYSGHGINETATRSPAFLLADAQSPTDDKNLYDMRDLGRRLEDIAKRYFHVLALINACYGGNVFDTAKAGGNPSISELPGSYALTAGSDKEPVASLGKPDDGSIFFDSLIKGITLGEADTDYARLIAVDGTLIQQGGITRLGALASYLETSIEIINKQKIPKGNGFLRLDKPWIGPIEPSNVVARGGFFFLSPIKINPQRLAVALDVPIGPVSSLQGRPDIKVFSAQEEYPIRGIDVSVHEGAIDWARVKERQGPTFAYIRASSWAGPDPAFQKHWKETAEYSIDHGGYHVFDYCLSADQQMRLISSAVPNEHDALPFAVAVEIPAENFNKKQYGCFKEKGIENAQQGILVLLEQLREFYGKVPLIYGNKYNLSKILDERFDSYMLWPALYRKSGKASASDLSLTGRNPWTIWQYTASLTVPGIGDNVDGNVFFGTEEQYLQFKRGTSNVALTAVTSAQ